MQYRLLCNFNVSSGYGDLLEYEEQPNQTTTTTTTTIPSFDCNITYWGYKELCIVNEWHNMTCLVYGNTTGYDCNKDYLLVLRDKSDISKKPSNLVSFFVEPKFYLILVFSFVILYLVYIILGRILR